MKRKRIKRAIMVMLCMLLLCSVALAASAIPNAVLKAADAVVRITWEDLDYACKGSGCIIESTREETYVITNYHVVEGGTQNILVWYGNASYKATLVNEDANRDLALLRFTPGVKLPSIKIAKFEPKRGADVYAIGFPAAADNLFESEAVGSTETTVTSGTVSTIRQTTALTGNGRTSVSVIQTDAVINSGNSGGPLVNHQGQIVGINTFGIDDAQGIFGAISATELQTFNSVGMRPSYGYPTWITYSAITLVSLVVVCAVLLVRRKCQKDRKDEKKRRSKSGKIETLLDYMQINGQQSAASTIGLLMPLLTEVRDAHNNGSTFPTLSPSSVLIFNGKTSVSDGINPFIFANGFTAPEIYRGKNYGAASDIYALGALLYFTWTTRTPANALERADLNESAVIPSEIRCINPGFSEVIEQCMRVNASDRIQDVQSLIVKLLPYRLESSQLPQEVMDNIVPAQSFTTGDKGAELRNKSADKENTPETRGRKKHPVSKIILSILVILILYCGAGLILLSVALNKADEGDFTGAQQLINKGAPLTTNIVSKYKDGIIYNYIVGGINLENNNYASAINRFSENPEYRNSENFIAEAASLKSELTIENSGIQDALEYLSSVLEGVDIEALYDAYEELLDSYILENYFESSLEVSEWIGEQIYLTDNYSLCDILVNGLYTLADYCVDNENFYNAYAALKVYYTDDEIEILYPDLKLNAYKECELRYYMEIYAVPSEKDKQEISRLGDIFREFGDYEKSVDYAKSCDKNS